MLKITEGKGFQLTFINGLTISVQFGPMNYCSNRDLDKAISDLRRPSGIVSSYDAEIAIWDSQGTWFNFGYDTVKGHCDPDTVGDWITYTQNSRNLEDLNELVIELGLKSVDND